MVQCLLLCTPPMPSKGKADPVCEFTLRHTILPFIRLIWRPRLIETPYFPEGPCFVYGNHSHLLDPFILNLFTEFGESTAGVMTHEFLRKGPLAYLLKGLGLVPTMKRVREPHLIRQIYKMLDQDRSVFIYPEGGRRWAGRPSPWIDTTAKLFIKAGVPVYPIITQGSYIGWPRWAKYPRPARIKVECLKPFTFPKKAPLEEGTALLKAAIDIDENIVDEDVKPKWAYRPAEGIHILLYRDPTTGENNGLFTPDGTFVRNQSGSVLWKMLPDSTLLDEKKDELYTTGDLYEKIKNLPLPKDAEGAIIRNKALFHEGESPRTLISKGKVQATLFDDAVVITSQSISQKIELDQVSYTGIERDYKLQLLTESTVYQLSFDISASALHWEDTIARLKT